MEKRKGDEQIYSTCKRNSDCKEDLVGKVSKAHAEAVSMCSAAILITLLIIYYAFITCSLDWPLFVAAVALWMFTAERVSARNRKILDLKKEANVAELGT